MCRLTAIHPRFLCQSAVRFGKYTYLRNKDRSVQIHVNGGCRPLCVCVCMCVRVSADHPQLDGGLGQADRVSPPATGSGARLASPHLEHSGSCTISLTSFALQSAGDLAPFKMHLEYEGQAYFLAPGQPAAGGMHAVCTTIAIGTLPA